MTTSSQFLSSLGSAVSPALANHLWQSTLVAMAAALLTLFLRHHSARARYWLWLAASLKFLIPFSLLVAIGNRLSWLRTSTPSTTPSLYFAIEEISQPFKQSAATIADPNAPKVVASTLPHLSTAIALVWLAGFLTVVFFWTIRWLRVALATRRAQLVHEGRELGILRRIEGLFGFSQPITLLQSRASLEPGIFGIFRPVLLWPEGISTRLDDAHLEAIVAHELWHVRRRDNLFAVLHMLVEAVFWFYPLVWWLGARLIDERERACDEEVVALGNDRRVYAESILKVCEFCLGSPLPCISGVTGADLKKRMVHIMNDRILHKLDFARKLLLTAVASLALVAPVVYGLLHATRSQAQTQSEAVTSATPVFDTVSIKRHNAPETSMRFKMMFSMNDGSFTAEGVTLRKLIEMAYHLQEDQLSGGPDWLDSAKFDVSATLNKTRAADLQKAGTQDAKVDDQFFLKSLLADYFKVAVHQEMRNLSAYELTVDDGGSKLQEVKDMGMFHLAPGELLSQGVPIELLASQLSANLGHSVIDKTGFKGIYSFDLRWTPDDPGDNKRKVLVRDVQMKDGHVAEVSPPATASNQTPAPTLLTAVQEQLGLKLEAKTEPVPVVVVDHAEQPTEN
jgi:uncharacterized protein (TIGR03435 family)